MDKEEKLRPTVSIAVGLYRFELSVNLGWYSGDPFKLFGFDLLNKYDEGLCVLGLQVAKLSFGVYLNEV